MNESGASVIYAIIRNRFRKEEEDERVLAPIWIEIPPIEK